MLGTIQKKLETTRIVILCCALQLVSSVCCAQITRIDSLNKILLSFNGVVNEKSILVNNEIAMSHAYVIPQTGIELAQKNIGQAESMNSPVALAGAWAAKGICHAYRAEFDEASYCYQQAKQIDLIRNDRSGLARDYYLNGAIHGMQTNCDSALYYYDEALKYLTPNSDARLNILILIGQGLIYEVLIQFEKGDSVYQNALQLAEGLKDIDMIARVQAGMSTLAFNNSQNEKAEELAFKALSIFKRNGDFYGKMLALMTAGNLEVIQSDYDKGMEYYIEIMRIADQRMDYFFQATIMGNISLVYEGMLNYQLAFSAAKRSYDLAILSRNLYVRVWTTDQLSIAYMRNYDFDNALKFLNEAYPLAEIVGNKMITADLYYTLGEIYSMHDEFSEGHKNLLKALTIYESLGSKYSYVRCALMYAQSLEASSAFLSGREAVAEMEKAIELNNEAWSIGRAEGFHTAVQYALRNLGSIYQNREDYRKALYYYQLEQEIKDTIITEENANTLSALQVQYDTEKKELEIVNLNQENELKNTEIQKQKLLRNSFIGGFAFLSFFTVVVIVQRNRVRKARNRSDELLLNILPSETAEELKANGSAKARSYDLVTVMFTDFKNFTQAAELLNAEELVSEINYCYSRFDQITMQQGLEKIKTIGDSYMCAGGLPASNETHASDVVLAGLAIRDFILKYSLERKAKGLPLFEIRIGIHTGPVVAGVVGIKKFAYDIWGDTVNIASRMESSGMPGRVNISGATYELVKDKFECEYRGKLEAKNKGLIDMHFVNNQLA